jgi:parallel beta-helix repeat protein
MTCNNVTVQNNDIGPCGSDAFQEWADGISISCRNSVVKNNMIQGPTDGGIVLFGAPGTQVFNNTIWILNVCVVETLCSNKLTFPAHALGRYQLGRLRALERGFYGHCGTR